MNIKEIAKEIVRNSSEFLKERSLGGSTPFSELNEYQKSRIKSWYDMPSCRRSIAERFFGGEVVYVSVGVLLRTSFIVVECTQDKVVVFFPDYSMQRHVCLSMSR